MEASDGTIVDLQRRLERLRGKLRDEPYGNEHYADQLLEWDKALTTMLEKLGCARQYRAVTSKNRPTRFGFKRDLIKVIDERLKFLAVYIPHGSTETIYMTGERYMKRDWLGAIAKGVEALPGGGILLGPLLKLRDDEKAAARNAEINKLFEENRKLTEEVLNSILMLQGSTENSALLAVSSRVADDLFAQERGQSATESIGRSDRSRFPFPFSPGLLMQELESLGFGLNEIVFALEKADFPVPQERNSVEQVISGFVKSMTGADREKLQLAIGNLYGKRSGSKILHFCSEFLVGGDHRSSSAGMA